MDRHSIEVLEFGAVLRELAELCFRRAGAAELEADFGGEGPGFAELAPRLEAVKAACGLLRAGLVKTGDGVGERLDDLAGVLDGLDKAGRVLELEELARIHAFVRGGGRARRALGALREAALEARGGPTDPDGDPWWAAGRQLLDAALAAYPDLRSLEQLFDRYLDAAGALKEEQIPELRAARQRIMAAQGELRRAAGQIMGDYAAYTSAELATLRDGRTVIPLKADFKGRVKGIVHQSSASGTTLFVEPFELVERNNACAEAEGAYAQAVHAILRQLSQAAAGQAAVLAEADAALAALDHLYCRARYSQLHDCYPAAAGGPIRLEQARHPLLGAKAVPIDIVFREGSPLMVISGPNTGGKTVALKTLGLLALMNQAGLDLPAALGSRLPVFGAVHADIGDEQSIAANLSTFSGHVSRIGAILRAAGADSLVLLDELGSGTDPAEGAALAVAVTERLLALGCHCLVTSHHGALKALAFGTPGAVNASMEFSEAELRPTYKVLTGLPGQSHALDIARRVGLPGEILDRAKEFLGKRETPLDELVRGLAERQRELLESRRAADALAAELEAGRGELERRRRDLAERELELRRSQSQGESGFLREARSTVEGVLRDLGSFKDQLDEAQRRRLDELARAARQSLAELSAAQAKQEAELADRARRELDPGELAAGREVWIRNSSQSGVLERQVKPGRWLVSVQNKSVEFRVEQLQAMDRAPAAAKAKPKAKPARSYSLEGGKPAAFSLDVRGMRMQECQDLIVRQIDMAMMQGMDYFSVIHGKGEGVLQKAIHDYLKDCPGVERYEFARPEDGGSGKTHVFLRH